jgi:hypothetical protein
VKKPYGLCGLAPIALAAALPSVGFPRSVWACGSLPCAQIEDVQPEDGSEGLPLNTEIRIQYFGSLTSSPSAACDDLARVRITSRDGSAAALNAAVLAEPQTAQGWFVAKPTQALAPNTVYEVEAEVEESGGCQCGQGNWHTVSTFTTGSDSDEAPPEFSGVVAFEYGELIQQSTDCGLFKVIPATPDADAPRDSSPDTRYNVYVDGAIAGRYRKSIVGSGLSPELAVDCGSTYLAGPVSFPPAARVEVRAIDIAGNESPQNGSVQVIGTCASPVDDAPTSNVPLVASSEVPPDTQSQETPPGCSTPSGPRTPGGARGMLLTCLGIGFARRTQIVRGRKPGIAKALGQRGA